MEVEINGARNIVAFDNVPLFGTVTITQTLIVSWLILIIISALCIWLGSGLKVTGISRKQAVAETIYTSLVKFVRGNMGPDFDRYIPLVGTIFVTSIFSNLISLVGIWSPTADLMTELAWALVVFVLITYHKIKASGIGAYLKGFLDPLFILLPLSLIHIYICPAFRLAVNAGLRAVVTDFPKKGRRGHALLPPHGLRQQLHLVAVSYTHLQQQCKNLLHSLLLFFYLDFCFLPGMASV